MLLVADHHGSLAVSSSFLFLATGVELSSTQPSSNHFKQITERSMSSSTSCGAYGEEVQLYYITVSISAAFTILVSFAYLCCLRSRLEGAPWLHAQFFFVIGAVKLIMAIVLFTALLPKCPINCSCQGDDPSRWVVYPIIAAVLSVRWLLCGFCKLRQAAALSKPGDVGRDSESSIYTRTPSSEVEVV